MDWGILVRQVDYVNVNALVLILLWFSRTLFKEMYKEHIISFPLLCKIFDVINF